MNRLHFGLLAALIQSLGLGGCASTGDVDAGGNLLQDALAREAVLTESYSVAAEDGFFTATVAGSGVPTVTPYERFYQLSVPIDSEIPAECLIYVDALDSASTLQGLLNELLDDFPRKRFLNIDAGNFDRLPFVYQESLYVTEQGAAGVLKGIVVPVGASTLACLHDEPGYSATFRQMVGGLARSLRFGDAAEAEPDPAFREILVWRLHDMKVGFTMNSVGRTGDGDIRSIVETALVIPRSAEETLAHDGYDVTYESERGELIAGRYADATSGELTLSIDLEQSPEGGYRVSGNFQGKEIDARLESASDPAGPWFQYLELVRAAHPADGRPRPIRMDSYVPSANPLQTISVEAKPTGQRVDGLPEYALLFAGLQATSVIDGQGQQAVSLRMGQLELSLDRAYLGGNP